MAVFLGLWSNGKEQSRDLDPQTPNPEYLISESSIAIRPILRRLLLHKTIFVSLQYS